MAVERVPQVPQRIVKSRGLVSPLVTSDISHNAPESRQGADTVRQGNIPSERRSLTVAPRSTHQSLSVSLPPRRDTSTSVAPSMTGRRTPSEHTSVEVPQRVLSKKTASIDGGVQKRELPLPTVVTSELRGYSPSRPASTSSVGIRQPIPALRLEQIQKRLPILRPEQYPDMIYREQPLRESDVRRE